MKWNSWQNLLSNGIFNLNKYSLPIYSPTVYQTSHFSILPGALIISNIIVFTKIIMIWISLILVSIFILTKNYICSLLIYASSSMNYMLIFFAYSYHFVETLSISWILMYMCCACFICFSQTLNYFSIVLIGFLFVLIRQKQFWQSMYPFFLFMGFLCVCVSSLRRSSLSQSYKCIFF